MSRLTLDHLVIAVRDLAPAAEHYRRLLGRPPSWHGNHPTYGTANVLFRLQNCYVELLAPADAKAGGSPWLDALRAWLDTHGEGLYAVAIGSPDIDATVAAVRERGLAVHDPADGDGVDAQTGARREWRNARMTSESTRGVNAFFIEHRSPPGALPLVEQSSDDRAGSVSAVDHTVLASSNLPASLALWQKTVGLDLRLSLEQPGGRTLHFLRLGDSILELAGDPAPERPGDRDLLWGLAYRVADVARTVERLRALDIDISDPRPGNAPGTHVADLKPGFSHDVRTLFIQKEVPRKAAV